MNGSEGPFEQALRVLRRRKWIVLAAVICVPLAAFLISHSKEKQYEATATLLSESTEGSPEAIAREVQTIELLAALPDVAVKTAKNLGEGITPGEVLESIEVSSASETANLTTITATTSSPQLSAKIANAYGRAYVEVSRERAQSRIHASVEQVERSLEKLTPEELAGPTGERQTEHLSDLELEEALRTGNISFVQAASIPSTPSAPRVSRDVVIGLIIGLILGLGLAALVERFDRRVRTLEELERRFSLPVIAKIPTSKNFRNGSPGTMLSAPEAEAFRTLRSNLRYFNLDGSNRAIVVTSPEAQDGKSTVAKGLAASMAEVGDNVLLLEADLRKPSSFRSGSGIRDGLSSVLRGSPVDSALIDIPIVTGGQEERVLWVLPNGPMPPNPSELLESTAMAKVMAGLMKRFDVIIIDTPALGFVRDAMTLAALGTEVLAVGALGRTSRDSIAEFSKALSMSGHKPVGLVATLTDFDRSQYTYYMRSRAAAR
jgi:capsular exopolysaccharide synthesis family protein